jgi:beta-barrel assembly-enhancing protease
MSAQGLAIQEQINYTRANEYEADRVGLQFLAQAGFDPMGMPSFFEVLSREAGTPGHAGAGVPADASAVQRAYRRDPRPGRARPKPREISESPAYELMRARIRALNARSGGRGAGAFRATWSGRADARRPRPATAGPSR